MAAERLARYEADGTFDFEEKHGVSQAPSRQMTRKDVALAWYDWLKEGETEVSVGTNRELFYGRVVERAESRQVRFLYVSSLTRFHCQKIFSSKHRERHFALQENVW